MFYFDFYFSPELGIQIELSDLLTFEISPAIVYASLIAVIALRIRKVYFLDKKRGRK